MRIRQIDYYLRHSEFSDPSEHAESYDTIPVKLKSVTKTVQGLMLHDYFGAHLYRDPPPGIATASRATLPISQRLTTFSDFGTAPLTTARPTSVRVVGTCRDFALLTCSILRHHRVSARVRCGFARYFHPPKYEDHWICEYWDKETVSWKMIDAQLDEAHTKHLSLAFEAVDIPKEEFLFPWEVWESHQNDLEQLTGFGHGDSKGFWFVRVNLARDFLALMKTEVSRWDTWRNQVANDKVASGVATAACDQLSKAAKHLDTNLQINPASFASLAKEIGTPHWCRVNLLGLEKCIFL